MQTTSTLTLEALVNLANGALDGETDASRAERERCEKEDKNRPQTKRRAFSGFVEGSEIWQAAEALNWPLLAYEKQGRQGDLFAAQLTPRHELDAEFTETLLPLALGGPEPADAAGIAEHNTALAWDEESVMTCCPRGYCVIPRSEWQDGYRYCKGC